MKRPWFARARLLLPRCHPQHHHEASRQMPVTSAVETVILDKLVGFAFTGLHVSTDLSGTETMLDVVHIPIKKPTE